MESKAKKPRRKPIKASTLTRHHWESMGYRVAFVERFIHQIHKRIDAWGFADHLAFHPGSDREVIALQSCAVDRLADHRKTIRENPIAQEWLRCGHRIVIMAWERGKKRGQPNRLVQEEQRPSDPP